MRLFISLILFWTVISLSACSSATSSPISQNKANPTDNVTTMDTTHDVIATIHTNLGDVKIRLYGDTPLHRDNFVKLAREGFYDQVLFHRVIDSFMVQTGDPDSRNAPAGKMLGVGGPGYQVDSEIRPNHFHKRGALAAARQGDNVNPTRASSGSQFYIVTGKKYNASQLGQMEKQLRMQATQQIFDSLAVSHRDEIMAMRRERNREGLQKLQDELADQAIKIAEATPAASLTDEQKEAYTTIGGTPHLDGAYTVFGEVIEGMDVIDAISAKETDKADRPLEDVRINSITIEND